MFGSHFAGALFSFAKAADVEPLRPVNIVDRGVKRTAAEDLARVRPSYYQMVTGFTPGSASSAQGLGEVPSKIQMRSAIERIVIGSKDLSPD